MPAHAAWDLRRGLQKRRQLALFTRPRSTWRRETSGTRRSTTVARMGPLPRNSTADGLADRCGIRRSFNRMRAYGALRGNERCWAAEKYEVGSPERAPARSCRGGASAGGGRPQLDRRGRAQARTFSRRKVSATSRAAGAASAARHTTRSDQRIRCLPAAAGTPARATDARPSGPTQRSTAASKSAPSAVRSGRLRV
jgi:hypothetical protein